MERPHKLRTRYMMSFAPTKNRFRTVYLFLFLKPMGSLQRKQPNLPNLFEALHPGRLRAGTPKMQVDGR